VSGPADFGAGLQPGTGVHALERAFRAPPRRRGLIWTLGLGAFGLAFAITTLTYLPVVLGRFTDSESLIALVLGAEGLFALLLSPVIGPWSDTFHTPLGRRRPFMLVALGPMAFCLCLVAFMPSLWTAALIVFAFFFAYYVYEAPYRGLYPDLLEPGVFGRAQSVQHVIRGVALAAALVGGGFLLDVWRPFPFLLAALVTTLACGAVIVLVREDGGHGRVFHGFRAYLATSWAIVREEPDVRRFLLANAAWEGTFAAMRIFVVLYVTKGLDQPARVASLVLAVVAGGYVVAAVGSGPIADRVGLARVIFGCSWVYGIGLLVGGLATEWHSWYYALIFPVAVAGGAVMTQSWALLFTLMPDRHRGAISGLATMTKGFGLLVGPLLAGAAIDLLSPVLDETDGYGALWPVAALPVLAAIPLVYRLMRVEVSGRAATGT
jgi:MFS family permease